MAKKNKITEPSYTTLANLAEVFSAAVFQTPALQQSNKLDEATLPNKENDNSNIKHGVIRQQDARSLICTVDTDDGLNVKAKVFDNSVYKNGDEVIIYRIPDNDLWIVLNGSKYIDVNDKRAQLFWQNLFQVNYECLPYGERVQNTFDVFDSATLMAVLGDIVLRLNALETLYNMHTHTVADGVAAVTPNRVTDDFNLETDMKSLENSKSSKFRVNYNK